MKKSIASDALKLTTSKIITMSISMITAMLLSRFRTLEEYGTYSQLLLVINLTTTIMLMGLPNSINFFLARADTDEERQKFLSIYFSLSTLLGFITGLVLVLAAPLIISYFNNNLINNFIYVLAVFPWTKIVLSSIDHVLIVYGKPNGVMYFRILNSILILTIIFTVESLGLSFSHYMTFYIIAEAALALFVYFIVYKTSGKIYLNFNLQDIKRILKFSLPLGLASVVGKFSIELDKLVIGKFFSTEDIAIYTNAAREMPITIVASALTAVLMPRLVKFLKNQEFQQAIDVWAQSIEASYIIICYFSFGIFAFAPDVISLLYSSKYLPGVAVFRVYSLVLLFRVTYFGMILNSIGRTKFIFYSSIISLAFNLVLNYLFYLTFGFIGPAIATFSTVLLVQLLQLIATSKSINIKLKHIFPWKKLGEITVLNIVLAIVFKTLKEIIDLDLMIGSPLESILIGIVWGIAYLIIINKRIRSNWIALNNHE